jgi:hypothetical protein
MGKRHLRMTKRRKSICMALPREISLLSRVMRPPVTKWGPLVTVGNTTRDKRWGVLYKPCRLPDRHLAVFPQSAASPLFLRHHHRRLSSSCPTPTRPSPTRGSSPTCRPSPMRRSPRRDALPRHTCIAVSCRRRAWPR